MLLKGVIYSTIYSPIRVLVSWLSLFYSIINKLRIQVEPGFLIWRRRRDSNPRWNLRPTNDLANRPLQPLGYPSVGYSWLCMIVLLLTEVDYTILGVLQRSRFWRGLTDWQVVRQTDTI